MLNDLIKLGNLCKQHDIIKPKCKLCKPFASQMKKAIKAKERENDRWNKHALLDELLICERCGQLFIPRPYARHKNFIKKFCSYGCRFDAKIILV